MNANLRTCSKDDPNLKRTCLTNRALLFAAACLPAACLAGTQARAQEPPDDVPLAPRMTTRPETYRLRVENREYGSVSLSADGGLHYTLIGRVTHPASTVALDRDDATPGQMLRSNGTGLAFAVNLGQSLRLRPASIVSTTGRPKRADRSFVSGTLCRRYQSRAASMVCLPTCCRLPGHR